MKKLLFTIFIFLLTVTLPGNAQIFNNHGTGTREITETHSNVKENSEERGNTGGFFKSVNDDFKRPEVGNGIGEVPIGEGLSILMLYSMFFGTVRFFKRKQNQFEIKSN